MSVTALAVVSLPGRALAHARLVKSEPASGAKIDSPKRVRLVFSEVPVLSMTRFHLVSSSGDTITLGTARIDSEDSHAVVSDVDRPLAPGEYHVFWTAAARDGHPSKGSFLFTVVRSALPVTETPPLTTIPVVIPAAPPAHQAAPNQAMGTGDSVWSVLARMLGYVSIFLVIGAVTFKYTVLGKADVLADATFAHVASTNAATLGFVASGGSLLSVILKMVRESADMPEIPIRAMMLGSLWGWSLIAAALASIVAAVAFRRAHSVAENGNANGWGYAAAAAAVLAICPALGGHAIGSDKAWLTVPADMVHVAGGSMWLGTLAIIMIVGISACLKCSDSVAPGTRVAQMINLFSPMALTCGAVVVGTGLIASVVHLPRVNALWTTPYGSALYRKLIFVILLFAAGAWNWRRMKPRLGTDAAVVSLRRSATAELVLAGVVLGLTAILVALAIPD